MKIREAKQGDEGSISRVVVDTWRTTYTGIVPQEYLKSLSYEKATGVWHNRILDTADMWPGWVTYVAEDDYCDVIGFVGGGPSQSSDLPFSSELGFIYLLKSYQRQGIGRQLATATALNLKRQGHRSMLVWVFNANPYRVFYEALGGQVVGKRSTDKYGGNLLETAYGWENLDVFEKMKSISTSE